MVASSYSILRQGTVVHQASVPPQLENNMAKGIGTVEIRVQHGKLTVVGLGKTPRGQRYIKESIPLEAKDMFDPNFKTELAEAVEKLFA